MASVTIHDDMYIFKCFNTDICKRIGIYIYIYMSMYMSLYINIFRDLESGLSKDLKDGERSLRRANAGEARGDTDVQFKSFVVLGERGENESNNQAACFPQDS